MPSTPAWDARGLGPLPRMGITSLDVSGDGQEIVGTIAAFGDPNFIVLDGAGKIVRHYKVGQQWIDDVAFLPGSKEVIALCTMPAGKAGDRALAFRLKDDQVLPPLWRGPPSVVAWSALRCGVVWRPRHNREWSPDHATTVTVARRFGGFYSLDFVKEKGTPHKIRAGHRGTLRRFPRVRKRLAHLFRPTLATYGQHVPQSSRHAITARQGLDLFCRRRFQWRWQARRSVPQLRHG